MFKLDEAIRRWKAGFATAGCVGQAQISELESHLRDQIDALQTTGLEEEEAFIVAKLRLGDRRELSEEFSKLEPRRQYQFRAIWMLAGYLFFTLVGSLVSLAGLGTSAGLGLAGLDAVPVAAIAAAIQISVWVFAFVALYKLWPIETLSRTRPNLKVALWLMGALLIIPAATGGFQILNARIAEPAWIGELFSWMAVYGMLTKLFVSGLCLLAIYKLVHLYSPPQLSSTG